MKDTLSTLDLAERPGQRITVFTKVRHGLKDQRVDVQPGEQVFSPGPHHGYYGYVHAREETMPPFTMLQQPADLDIPHTAFERAARLAANDKTDNVRNEPPARLATDDKTRKATPLFAGLLRYFPDACAEVAALSQAGNDKHNPGEPLHWARSKSGDELDCLLRHLAEAGTVDTDGFFHDVKVAWRALANLQKLLEKERNLPISPGSRP